MIRIGEYQTLKIVRELPQGFYLLDEEDDDEVLLPRAYITVDMRIEDEIEVFVYCDSEEREVATTERPLITVGKCALLPVTAVTKIGAFCHWGTSKDLLIPFHNQKEKLEEGLSYVVYMYVDDVTDRLVGTTKLSRHLIQTADEQIKVGEEVDVLVIEETTIGYKLVVNQKFSGLIYKTDLDKNLERGDQFKGFVKPIRPDGKLDIGLNPIGLKHVEVSVQKLLAALKKGDGYLPLNDKSDPAKIREMLGMSKKVFKKAVGGLYKVKKIDLEENGIRLNTKQH